MIIEGMHNQTGKWVEIASADADADTVEEQSDAILKIDGIMGQVTMWKTVAMSEIVEFEAA